jgi:toxin ParE1/3/4
MIRFIPVARRELARAALYYDGRQHGLGDRLLEVVGAAVRDIRDFPNAYPMIDDVHRRCLTRVFPYAIVYRIEFDIVWVIAVAHASRRPNYWRRRRLGNCP